MNRSRVRLAAARSQGDEWLTAEEICTELKVSRRTWDRWRALGTGPRSKRVGGLLRVRRSWLEAWLDPDEPESA